MGRNRSLRLQKVDGKPGEVYYPLRIVDVPVPTPGPHELLVRISAIALNHRDLFQRRHLYPGISFTSPLFADGCGTVVSAHETCAPNKGEALVGQRVVLTPSRGWGSDPVAPEDPAGFAVCGASRAVEGRGTGQDYVVVHEDEVERAPDHLTDAEAAALPLAGLTAWRAVGVKSGGRAAVGNNVLVTGIGGGVALAALQFLVAGGCRVFVTSGSDDKIRRALDMGAAGGVNYKTNVDADGNASPWEARLGAMLPRDRPLLDLVVDGAGGDVVARTVRLFRPGGVISQYGMTVAPRMDWLMSAVMRNLELRSTTGGSRAEFAEMVAFVAQHRIRPEVSRVTRGLGDLDGVEELFGEMDAGKQFGKLVILVGSEAESGDFRL